MYVRIASTVLATGSTRGAGHIWLNNVKCHGNETRLIDCHADSPGRHTCTHQEDAGVTRGQSNSICREK